MRNDAERGTPSRRRDSRMQQRAVALRDLQTAKKYGTITRAYDGPRGDKRWKIEYGGIVYITDAQQKLVITTYQMNARDPTPLWTPPAPYKIRPPVPPPRLMFTRAPYHIQPLGGPTLPWPVPIILTPAAPPLTESPALPPLPENY